MATSTIGALNVEISADTSGVDKALKSTEKSVSKTSKAVGKSSDDWNDWGQATKKNTSRAGSDVEGFSFKLSGAFTTGIKVIGAATAALVAYATVQGKAIRETETLALMAGLTTEEFKRVSFVMGTVGISAEKFGDIMKDTQERVGDFLATGGGPFQDFADVMGYTEKQAVNLAAEFEKMSGQEVLQAMVNRMEEAGKSSQQMSFALEGIASDTTRLIPLLQNGGEAAEKMGERFDEVEIGLSEEERKQFTMLADNVDLAQSAFVSFINNAISPFLPAMNKASQALTDFFASANAGIEINQILDDKEIIKDISSIDALDKLMRRVKKEQAELSDQITDVRERGNNSAYVKTLQAEKDELTQVSAALRDQKNAIEAANEAKALLPKATTDLGGTGSTDDPQTAKDRDKAAKQEEENRRYLESLKQRFMTQEQLEKHAYNKELERVASIFEGKEQLTTERQQLEADMLQAHQEKLQSIRENEGQSLDQIKERFKSEEQIAQEYYQTQLNMVREAYGTQNAVTAEQRELEANLLQEHQDRLAEIRNTGETDSGLDNDFVEQLAMRFQTEAEMEVAAFEAERERLREHLAAKKIITEEDRALMENLEKDHSDRMVKIKQDERRAQIGIASNTLGALATAFQSGNEKMQKIGKKFAIARAVLAGGQAAVDAWRSGMETGGPWAPLVAAAYTAASLARTGAMISSIKGGSSPSKGGSVARPNVPSGSPGGSGNNGSSQQNQQNPDRRVYINIEGDSDFSGDRVLKLIGAMNDAVGEGVELISSNGAS